MFAKRFIDTVLHRDKSDEVVTAQISQAVQHHECAVSNLANALKEICTGEKSEKAAPASTSVGKAH